MKNLEKLAHRLHPREEDDRIIALYYSPLEGSYKDIRDAILNFLSSIKHRDAVDLLEFHEDGSVHGNIIARVGVDFIKQVDQQIEVENKQEGFTCWSRDRKKRAETVENWAEALALGKLPKILTYAGKQALSDPAGFTAWLREIGGGKASGWIRKNGKAHYDFISSAQPLKNVTESMGGDLAADPADRRVENYIEARKKELTKQGKVFHAKLNGTWTVRKRDGEMVYRPGIMENLDRNHHILSVRKLAEAISSASIDDDDDFLRKYSISGERLYYSRRDVLDLNRRAMSEIERWNRMVEDQRWAEAPAMRKRINSILFQLSEHDHTLKFARACLDVEEYIRNNNLKEGDEDYKKIMENLGHHKKMTRQGFNYRRDIKENDRDKINQRVKSTDGRLDKTRVKHGQIDKSEKQLVKGKGKKSTRSTETTQDERKQEFRAVARASIMKSIIMSSSIFSSGGKSPMDIDIEALAEDQACKWMAAEEMQRRDKMYQPLRESEKRRQEQEERRREEEKARKPAPAIYVKEKPKVKRSVSRWKQKPSGYGIHPGDDDYIDNESMCPV